MKTQPADVGVVRRLDRLYEYDREPVAQNQLHGCAHFAGIYAGEHVAATEFVIGALFVSWGARAGDVLIGLLLGNLMAVLSWTLVCAPIATQTRLTLYWYLRRIAGPGVTTIYNVLNAVLYCILAGSMITVSASAIRIPFGIPPQTHWYPDDMRFVLVVLGVGGVVVALAIWGFTRLAQFATLCAPWILAMFIAGALATWPDLAASVATAGGESAGFLDVARARIWTGVPVDGGEPITFWQIAAFAWICNIAMHLGLSDMAILRYARHASYGLNSAFGMFLGHYVAWIAAGIMGAAAALAGAAADRARLRCGGNACPGFGWGHRCGNRRLDDLEPDSVPSRTRAAGSDTKLAALEGDTPGWRVDDARRLLALCLHQAAELRRHLRDSLGAGWGHRDRLPLRIVKAWCCAPGLFHVEPACADRMGGRQPGSCGSLADRVGSPLLSGCPGLGAEWSLVHGAGEIWDWDRYAAGGQSR
jgi:hypothetical protein